MSKPESGSATCPKCKHTFQVTYWASVNITLNPELRERVLSGDIRKHACPKCRQQLTIDTDLLYHDMSRKFMVSYQVAKDGQTHPIDSRLLEAISASMADYQLRFVVSWSQLPEKIRMFEAGLDDNQIELIKLIVANKAYGHVNFGDDCIYFLEKREKPLGEGEISFEVYQDGQLLGTCQYPLAEYNKVANQVQQQLGSNYGAGEWKTVNQASIRGHKGLQPDYNRALDLAGHDNEIKEQSKHLASRCQAVETAAPKATGDTPAYARLIAGRMIHQQLNKPFLGRPYLKWGQCFGLWSYLFELGGILAAKHAANLEAFVPAFLGGQGDSAKEDLTVIANSLIAEGRVNKSMKFFDYVQTESIRRAKYKGDVDGFLREAGKERVPLRTAAELAQFYAIQGAALGTIFPDVVRTIFQQTYDSYMRWEQFYAAGLDIRPYQASNDYEKAEKEENEGFMAYCREAHPQLYSVLNEQALAQPPKEDVRTIGSLTHKQYEGMKGYEPSQSPTKLDFTGKESVGKCPKCGGMIFETEDSYICERSQAERRACKFELRKMKTIFGGEISKEQVQKLLTTGRTDLLNVFVRGRPGRPFLEYLKLENGELRIVRAPREKPAS